MKPQFKHDCDHCIFIGTILSNLCMYDHRVEVDLYRSCEITGGFILRASDEGNDYISTPNVGKYLGVTLGA